MNTVFGSCNSTWWWSLVYEHLYLDSATLLCQLPRTLRREIWASQSLAFAEQQAAESVLWGHMTQEWQERRIWQMPRAKCTVHGLTHSWKKKGHFPPFGGLCVCSHTLVLVVGWLVGCWRAAAAVLLLFLFVLKAGLAASFPVTRHLLTRKETAIMFRVLGRRHILARRKRASNPILDQQIINNLVLSSH
jgi:hypothetical protein